MEFYCVKIENKEPKCESMCSFCKDQIDEVNTLIRQYAIEDASKETFLNTNLLDDISYKIGFEDGANWQLNRKTK